MKITSFLSSLLTCFAFYGMAQSGNNNVEWPAYGGDPGGMRHTSSNKINTSNISSLKVAWTYHTGELGVYQGTNAAEKAAFEATPIMVDGTLYFSTPSSRVFALDAATGAEKWQYDPGIDLKRHYSEITSRGVSTWPGPDVVAVQTRRIFVATIDGRLIALDAATGKPVTSFGKNGTIDLRKDMGEISVTSPPAVVGNVVITGSSLGDNHKLDYERGVVKAFDVFTGDLLWSWDPIPRDAADPAFATAFASFGP